MISIITITYNAAQWLERTMRSVLAQTNTEYEYIIVDGASTDGTQDIIKSLEPQFNSRLSWQSEPDKGLYDAMNKGILASHGEYVLFRNSGDIMSDDKVIENFLTHSSYGKYDYYSICFFDMETLTLYYIHNDN